ncbi:hypothetical protein MJN69_30015, partial [Salmonella enterica subsp. enterica serovar Kentucky]|nr:hypothetical protein [Salmonella enterica subsp. enterica serovar Kentucky]
DGKRDIGGWANITTLVKQEKAKNKATWFFDAGDYFTGPYISSWGGLTDKLGGYNTLVIVYLFTCVCMLLLLFFNGNTSVFYFSA